MRDSPGIKVIFERDKEGNYTKDALLYQNILHYSIDLEKEKEERNSFRVRELARWLMTHNLEFANEFKGTNTRMSYRIENRLPRIKAKLNSLESVFLIQRVGMTKAKKIDFDIPLYKFTRSGAFLSWLIEIRNENKDVKMAATQKLFDMLDRELKTSSDSRALFLSKFFGKLVDKGTLISGIEYFLNYSIQMLPIQNELFLEHAFLNLSNIIQWIPFYPETFRETITEMDEQTRRLLLMQLKLVCEEVYNTRSSSADWEIVRNKNISDYSKITVPGYCQECHVKALLVIDIFDHLDAIASAGRAYNVAFHFRDCKNCGKKMSIIVLASPPRWNTA